MDGKKKIDNNLAELTAEDFAHLFGTTAEDILDNCGELISEIDFRYKIVKDEERDRILLAALKKINSDKLNIAGAEKKSIWEKGWSENLQNFIKKGCDWEELIPKYYRPGQPLRINKKVAKGYDPNFEYNFFRVLRLWLFSKYFNKAGAIYEFGCGPGHNLVSLAKLYPDKKIYGLDWANSSLALLNKIAAAGKYNIKGYLFDMFNPNSNQKLHKAAGVITMGALEQLGDNFKPFIQYLLKNRPRLCINVEPLCELYDADNLLDYIAILHHKKRNLLGDYLSYLKGLKRKNLIDILKVQRVFMGGVLEEGWSYIVWQPK